MVYSYVDEQYAGLRLQRVVAGKIREHCVIIHPNQQVQLGSVALMCGRWMLVTRRGLRIQFMFDDEPLK